MWLCSGPILRAGERPLLGWGVGSATSFQRTVGGGGSVVERPDGHTCTGDHSQRPPCRSRDGMHPGRDVLRGPPCSVVFTEGRPEQRLAPPPNHHGR